MINLEFQNAVSSVQRWNDEILNCVAIKERTCVNAVKHRESKVFATKEDHKKHTVACYGHVAFMAAPPVGLEDADDVEELTGTGRGRARRIGAE